MAGLAYDSEANVELCFQKQNVTVAYENMLARVVINSLPLFYYMENQIIMLENIIILCISMSFKIIHVVLVCRTPGNVVRLVEVKLPSQMHHWFY